MGFFQSLGDLFECIMTHRRPPVSKVKAKLSNVAGQIATGAKEKPRVCGALFRGFGGLESITGIPAGAKNHNPAVISVLINLYGFDGIIREMIPANFLPSGGSFLHVIIESVVAGK